jgi:sigma-B regulation protein RsbU (phosphoserine phosphatase)
VDRGSTLLLYTDGITEVRNARGEEFGMEGIVEQVKPGDTRSAREILEGLLEAARCFGGGAPFRDDATLLVVQRQA